MERKMEYGRSLFWNYFSKFKCKMLLKITPHLLWTIHTLIDHTHIYFYTLTMTFDSTLIVPSNVRDMRKSNGSFSWLRNWIHFSGVSRHVNGTSLKLKSCGRDDDVCSHRIFPSAYESNRLAVSLSSSFRPCRKTLSFSALCGKLSFIH